MPKATSTSTKKVRRTSLFWKNPKTGNLVCYQRAHQLGLLNKKKVAFGVKKGNRLVATM